MSSSQPVKPKAVRRGSMVNSYAARMQGIYVAHRRFVKAVNTVGDALAYGGSLREVPCVFLTGPTGVGKTTAKDILLQIYPTVLEENGATEDIDIDVPRVQTNGVPLLCIEMPTDPTPISVCKTMLKGYGDPNYNKGDKFTLEDRLDEFIDRKETCGVLIDEAQRLADRSGAYAAQAILDWLKNRHAKKKVVFVLVGLGRVTAVMERDPQLRRRYDAQIRLLPYSWSSDDLNEDDPDRKDFLGCLRAVTLRSPLPFADEVNITVMSGADVLRLGKRFLCASQGRMGLLTKLLCKVARDADSGLIRPVVDMAALYAAFEASIRSSDIWVNPFGKLWDGQAPPPVEDDFAPVYIPRRRRSQQHETQQQRRTRALNALRKR